MFLSCPLGVESLATPCSCVRGFAISQTSNLTGNFLHLSYAPRQQFFFSALIGHLRKIGDGDTGYIDPLFPTCFHPLTPFFVLLSLSDPCLNTSSSQQIFDNLSLNAPLCLQHSVKIVNFFNIIVKIMPKLVFYLENWSKFV